MSFEVANSAPERGMGQVYKTSLVSPTIGAFAIFTLVYADPSNKELLVSFGTGITLKIDISVSKDEEFYLYIRNSPSGFLTYTSITFKGSLTTRANTIEFGAQTFSDNCYVRRAVYDIGPEPT
ncbi:uncharacterized protein [Dermacentor andersoni]|uniref:uncharacterized protein n=1 Tax=Dermacentor andersoni TaxID=34620 RepID=UPI002416CFB2|nr:uncharacterized protein LOC129383097 isoform X2 [Dermacentor andersoni]